jgi:hypothetical protein
MRLRHFYEVAVPVLKYPNPFCCAHVKENVFLYKPFQVVGKPLTILQYKLPRLQGLPRIKRGRKV